MNLWVSYGVISGLTVGVSVFQHSLVNLWVSYVDAYCEASKAAKISAFSGESLGELRVDTVCLIV